MSDERKPHELDDAMFDDLMRTFADFTAAMIMMTAVDEMIKALRGEKRTTGKRVIALGPAPEPVEIIEEELDFGTIEN